MKSSHDLSCNRERSFWAILIDVSMCWEYPLRNRSIPRIAGNNAVDDEPAALHSSIPSVIMYRHREGIPKRAEVSRSPHDRKIRHTNDRRSRADHEDPISNRKVRKSSAPLIRTAAKRRGHSGDRLRSQENRRSLERCDLTPAGHSERIER